MQPQDPLVGPVGTPPVGSPADSVEGQVTVEQAWNLYRKRIATHNVALIKGVGGALDAVDNLMRTH